MPSAPNHKYKAFNGVFAATGTYDVPKWKTRDCPKCGAKAFASCQRWRSEKINGVTAERAGQWVKLKGPHAERQYPGGMLQASEDEGAK